MERNHGKLRLKDPAGDVNKAWITNLVAEVHASTPLYGLVNEDMTELKIPVGQTVAVSTSYPSILFEGFYGPDGETNIPDGGSVTGLIEEGKFLYKTNLEVTFMTIQVPLLVGTTFSKLMLF